MESLQLGSNYLRSVLRPPVLLVQECSGSAGQSFLLIQNAFLRASCSQATLAGKARLVPQLFRIMFGSFVGVLIFEKSAMYLCHGPQTFKKLC